jgi:hypothetical protein
LLVTSSRMRSKTGLSLIFLVSCGEARRIP